MVWRLSNGTWYGSLSSLGGCVSATSCPANFSRAFGIAGDLPPHGDFDGDGTTDVAVFRPSNVTWYIQPSSGAPEISVPFGAAGDIPVLGDFDGDRKTDIAVFRPSNGTWYIQPSSGSQEIVAAYGIKRRYSHFPGAGRGYPAFRSRGRFF